MIEKLFRSALFLYRVRLSFAIISLFVLRNNFFLFNFSKIPVDKKLLGKFRLKKIDQSIWLVVLSFLSRVLSMFFEMELYLSA